MYFFVYRIYRDALYANKFFVSTVFFYRAFRTSKRFPHLPKCVKASDIGRVPVRLYKRNYLSQKNKIPNCEIKEGRNSRSVCILTRFFFENQSGLRERKIA